MNDDFDIDDFGLPVQLSTGGVRCGRCGARHASARAVQLCHWRSDELDAQIADEHRAEQAVERWHEERGYDDARAQEDHERAMGIW